MKYRGAGGLLWDSGGGGKVGALMIPISGDAGRLGVGAAFNIR